MPFIQITGGSNQQKYEELLHTSQFLFEQNLSCKCITIQIVQNAVHQAEKNGVIHTSVAM